NVRECSLNHPRCPTRHSFQRVMQITGKDSTVVLHRIFVTCSYIFAHQPQHYMKPKVRARNLDQLDDSLAFNGCLCLYYRSCLAQMHCSTSHSREWRNW